MPTVEELTAKMTECVAHYTWMQNKTPKSSMLREVKWQFADMANGGDGGTTGAPGDPSIRDEYYAGYPDSWFAEVIDLMQWFPNGVKQL